MVILSLIFLSMIFYFKSHSFCTKYSQIFLTLLNLACPHVCTRIKLLSIVCGESGWLLRGVFRSI